MKIILKLLVLFVFVINLKISVSAKVDVMEIDVNSPLVSEEKIYELNQQYHAGTMDKKDIYFFYENSVRIFGSVPEPIVVMIGRKRISMYTGEI